MSKDNRRRRWYHNKPKGPKPEGQAAQPQSQTGPRPQQGQPQRQGVQANREPIKKPELNLPQEPPVEVPPELLPEKSLASQAVQGVIENPQNCVVCEMPVRSYYTSIKHKSGEPAHFDCVLRELIKENQPKLGKARRIYYIGAGNFALVKEVYDKRGHFKSYEVIERITYETKEK